MFTYLLTRLSRLLLLWGCDKAQVCEPVWPSGKALVRLHGKQKGIGSIPFRLSLLFKKVVVCGEE